MKGTVGTVREKLDQRCLINSGLNKDGCMVSMQGAPRTRLIVDFDKPGSPLRQNQTRCDYLLVAEGSDGRCWVAPLELKRGRLRTDEVVRQLQAAASAAELFVPSNEPVRFRPVAASGSRHKAEINKLKSKDSKVRFHGHDETVRLMSCGARLAGVLRRF